MAKVTPAPRRVYIAGPFRAQSQWGVTQNIRAAEVNALAVWRAGHVAICPHLNSQNFTGAVPDAYFLHGDLEILRVCTDLLNFMPIEAQKSRGTQKEIEQAAQDCAGATHLSASDNNNRVPKRPEFLEPYLTGWGE